MLERNNGAANAGALDGRIHRTAREIERIEIIRALELLSKRAPSRQWLVEPWIPHREVTLISGDGGIGKSTIALQLCAASAAGMLWFGLEVRPGAALYLSCEDDIDEIHFRLEQIVAHEPEMHLDRLHIISLAGRDAILACPSGGGMRPTRLFDEIERIIAERGIGLLVLDAAADVFGGDEIDRTQTRGFIQLLRGLAIRQSCAIVLLSHPSVDGMRTGRGCAGSTAWNNSVRSRLYFTRATASDDSEPDPDLRVLELAKSNRGKIGQKLFMRWHDGRFILDGGGSLDGLARQLRAERVFIEAARIMIGQGQTLSPNRNQTYAPQVIAEHPLADGIGKRELERAMQILLSAGKLRIENHGPPSRRYKRLAIDAAGAGS